MEGAPGGRGGAGRGGSEAGSGTCQKIATQFEGRGGECWVEKENLLTDSFVFLPARRSLRGSPPGMRRWWRRGTARGSWQRSRHHGRGEGGRDGHRGGGKGGPGRVGSGWGRERGRGRGRGGAPEGHRVGAPLVVGDGGQGGKDERDPHHIAPDSSSSSARLPSFFFLNLPQSSRGGRGERLSD